ncbi:Polycystic kidney disease 2 1 protein, partial [Globisporangium splendens]
MKTTSGTGYGAARQKGDDQGSVQRQTAGDVDGDHDMRVSVQDAYSTPIHDRKMKHALVRIPFPILYFGLFVATLFEHIPSTSLYELGCSVSSTLASSGADTVTADSTMKFINIQTIDDMFSWLTDTFVPSVFVTEDYNGDALEKDKWGRVAMFNKVLGAVHFERTLAHIHPCQAAQFLKDLYSNCSDPAHTATESLLLSFDTNATEATNVIDQLKATGTWLDFATQSLTITIVSYNGELQGYAVTELSIQFNQGGSIDTSSWTTPALSDPHQTTEPIVLDVLVGLCFLSALANQVVEFVRHRRDRGYFMSVWTIIEHASSGVVIAFYVVWLSIVLFMYQHSFRDNLARLVVSGKTFAADSDERNGLMAVTKSLQRIARLTIALRLIALFAVFLLGLRIVKRFRFHPRLNILTRTIASALDQFRWFFVVFVVIFITFAVSGTVLFGDRVEGFSSLQLSIETCINMLFGDFDYSTIQGLYTPVAMIYYWGIETHTAQSRLLWKCDAWRTLSPWSEQ